MNASFQSGGIITLLRFDSGVADGNSQTSVDTTADCCNAKLGFATSGADAEPPLLAPAEDSKVEDAGAAELNRPSATYVRCNVAYARLTAPTVSVCNTKGHNIHTSQPQLPDA